ncbi:hypothetical protein AB0387_20490 [Streptomyces sp. NPDC089173]|uniref:hypothetical protein n=1 Tax=Streptomyces sp. NPDC089173 TaxID=3154965 RepID=UPI00344B90FE
MTQAPGPWSNHATETRNSTNGGTFHSPVIQTNSLTGLTITTTTAAPEPPPARQLPTPPRWWVDRDADLTLLERHALSRRAAHGVTVIALHGAAGSGTTALASGFLHGLRGHHPGGQLYVDMRGGEPDGPLSARRALGFLLRSVRSGAPPVDAEERASWWRSVTAERAPMCLLLDNAVHARDVRVCLPAGCGHLVLTTSRSPLVDLGPDGAIFHGVGPLPRGAARRYLALRSDEERLRAEPAAAEQLVQLAAGLPAALSLTAAQLALHPERPLSALVRALTGSRGAAQPAGATMTNHLAAAYAGLDPDTARTCRDLSRLPVHDIDTALVAAVRGISPEDATGHLSALAAAAVLENLGSHELRGPLYRFVSPGIRERVRELAHGSRESDGEGPDVLGRALGWALAAASAADAQATDSHFRTLDINPGDLPHHPQHPVRHAHPEAAIEWLSVQSENLLALVRAAHHNGLHAYVWRLVYSMWPWWRAAGRSEEWIEVHALALVSLGHDRSAGDLEERHLLNTYGLGLRLADDPIALRTFTRVREMASLAGDVLSEGQAFYELGATHLQRGDAAEAVPFLQRARSIRAEHSYTRGVALADILLGQAALRMPPADTGEALRRFRDARTALEGVDAYDAARALAWQGRAHLQTGELPAGEGALRTAAQEFLDCHAPRKAAQALEWLGCAAEDGGRRAEARTLYSQALSLYLPVNGADADRIRDRLARLN